MLSTCPGEALKYTPILHVCQLAHYVNTVHDIRKLVLAEINSSAKIHLEVLFGISGFFDQFDTNRYITNMLSG